MFYNNAYASKVSLHDSIVVSIPACHAGDRGSIPRRGVLFLSFFRFTFVANVRPILCEIHYNSFRTMVVPECPKEVLKYTLEF